MCTSLNAAIVNPGEALTFIYLFFSDEVVVINSIVVTNNYQFRVQRN